MEWERNERLIRWEKGNEKKGAVSIRNHAGRLRHIRLENDLPLQKHLFRDYRAEIVKMASYGTLRIRITSGNPPKSGPRLFQWVFHVA